MNEQQDKQQQPDQPKWEYKDDQETTEVTHAPDHSSVSWTASMHDNTEKPSIWYPLFLLGTVVSAAIAYWVTRDVVMTIAVIVVASAAGYFSGHKPPPKDYRLTATSLTVGGKTYKLEDFKSFSVVDEPDGRTIWLKPIKRLALFLVIYFPADREAEIVTMLSGILPNEPREPDGIDKLSKKLKL